jgi:hypothetical protein
LIAEASMKTSLFSRAWRHNTAALNCIDRMWCSWQPWELSIVQLYYEIAE